RSIEGHKEIAHRECPATHGQPEEALTEIGTTGFAGKPAIPCDQKNITGSIRRGCCATGPDATLSRVGSRVEDGHLRQRSGIVAHHPTVIGVYIAGTTPNDIHYSIQ